MPDRFDPSTSLIRYDFECRETSEHGSQLVSLVVKFTLSLACHLSPAIIEVADVKKVIWSFTRTWFEKQLINEFPAKVMYEFPKELMDTDALKQLTPANISYPCEWKELEEDLNTNNAKS